MFADREMLAEGIGYHLVGQNAMLAFTKTIHSSPYCQVPPPVGNRVRMESRVIFYFQLLPGNRVRFCQISHDNLKLRFLPAFVLNFLAQGIIPMEFIHCFKQRVDNIQGTEWERRIKVEKKVLYQEMLDRIRDELEALQDQEQEKSVSPLTGAQVTTPEKATQLADTRLTECKSRKREEAISKVSPFGLSLPMSTGTMFVVVAAIRITTESCRCTMLPMAVFCILMIALAILLTHWTVQFEKKRNRRNERSQMARDRAKQASEHIAGAA